MLLKRRPILVFLLQLALIVMSVTLAWLLRFNFAFPHIHVFLLALPVLLLVRTAAMARFNLFHGYWSYTGISDAIDVSKAVFTGSLMFLIAERWIIGGRSFPLSVYVIEAILTACALGGVRMLPRVFRQKAQERSNQIDSKSVVVIGAGCGAAMLLLELPRRGYTARALVDDDPAKAGVKLHGIPVAGRLDDLPEIVCRYNPDELMIAIPSATREQMQRITECCQRTGLLFRTIPGLADLLDGKVTVDQLRNVNLEDLLGREPVKFNLEAVRRKIRSRVVMVTGAAGSIGSELCRQLLRYSPSKLICVDQSETPLFNLQQANGHSEVETAYCVADIADRSRMSDLMRGTRRKSHISRGGIQARAADGGESAGGGEEQCVRPALIDRGCRPVGLRGLPAYLLRQGRQPDEFHGLHQENRRADCCRPPLSPHALPFRALRECAWFARKRSPIVPGATQDQPPDHHHPSGHHALLYDHPGGGLAGPGGVRNRRKGRHSGARHGRAGPYCGYGADTDPSFRNCAGPGKDRLYRASSRGKALRGTLLRFRGTGEHQRQEGAPHAKPRHKLAELADSIERLAFGMRHVRTRPHSLPGQGNRSTVPVVSRPWTIARAR